MECVDEPVFYLSAKSIEDRVSHSREMGGLWATSFIISIFCPIKLVKKNVVLNTLGKAQPYSCCKLCLRKMSQKCVSRSSIRSKHWIPGKAIKTQRSNLQKLASDDGVKIELRPALAHFRAAVLPGNIAK